MIQALNVFRFLMPQPAAPEGPPQEGATPDSGSPLQRDRLLVSRRDADGDRRLTAAELGSDKERRHARFDRNVDGALTAGELAAGREVRASLRELRQARQAVRAVREAARALQPPVQAPPEAQPSTPPPHPTFGYTLRYGHTAASLAEQFETDLAGLMALNGWGSPDVNVPAGTVIQLPDIPATRALAAGYGGVIVEPPTAPPAAAPEASAPEAPPVDATVVGVPNPNSFFLTQFRHARWNPDSPPGSNNCGPASLAMALRAIGLQVPGVTAPGNAEQLIDATRLAMGAEVDSGGRRGDAALTNISQVIRGARAAGAECAWVTFKGLDAELAAGRPVVAAGNPAAYNGDWPGRGISNSAFNGGHFILITGKDAAGNYLINDPLSNVGSVAIAPSQMEAFLAYYGPGSAVAIVNPGAERSARPRVDALPPMTSTPAATGDTAKLLGALSAEQVEQVLAQRGSKLAGQGYGAFIVGLERAYGVPAVQFLAQAVMESQIGSDNGYAQPGFNIGNIRPGTTWNGPVVNGPCGTFRVYPSWEAGIEDYFRLLACPLYAGKNLKEQIYTYAPPSENNSNHYYNRVVQLIAEWTGIQM